MYDYSKKRVTDFLATRYNEPMFILISLFMLDEKITMRMAHMLGTECPLHSHLV